jgi:hypothetical protein
MKVNDILPHQRQRFHLYECDEEESLFRENSSEMAMRKVAPNVEGFYESHVPLVFRYDELMDLDLDFVSVLVLASVMVLVLVLDLVFIVCDFYYYVCFCGILLLWLLSLLEY